MKWTADFETTTDINDCRIWAWGVCSIDEIYKFEYGNTMDGFIEWMKKHCRDTLYFHNLKFDGEFIISWLFNHNFKHNSSSKDLEDNQFSTLISDKGNFYCMEICFKKHENTRNTIKIIDSLKILNFGVDKIAKMFNLPINKLKINYHKKREYGHILTKEEVAYLRNDVEIMSMALKVLFKDGHTQMTQGSNAFKDYKNIITAKKFKYWFPVLPYDADIRQFYKGAFTYLNPIYKNKDVGPGIVLDVNSLYPWTMRNCLLPYGEGKFFYGKYNEDKDYPLYIQMLTCNFILKQGYIPTIQLKNNLSFIPTEYITDSGSEDITLCLSNVDLELFFEHYYVYNITWHSGWKFQASNKLFTEYIDKWINIKIQSEIEGNYGMRTLAKLMLNALYGKFALNPHVQSKIPYLKDGIVKYSLGPDETRNPVYIPVGGFITAHARYKSITAAQSCYDRFMYCDTDSLHLEGWELPSNLEIDKVKLGAWKHESSFIRARYLRSKCYLEETLNNSFYMPDKNIYGNTYYKITCAGMPKECYENVTWENFVMGQEFKGKLRMKHVKGGICLVDTPFSLKIN